MARSQIAKRCSTCKGRGKTYVKWTAGRFTLRPRPKVTYETCPKCRGLGFV